MTVVAVETFGPDMAQFKTWRDSTAWFGFVSKQHSSGGKVRLGSKTKAGQADICRLLIIRAMSRLCWLGRPKIGRAAGCHECWRANGNVGRDHAGRQDHSSDLGNAEEERRFQEFRRCQSRHDAHAELTAAVPGGGEKATTSMGKMIEQFRMEKASSAMRAESLM